MISWIQNTFQKHFKWLFLTLLVVVIIGFVFVTGSTSNIVGGRGHKVARRDFFGINLNSKDGQERVFGDASLSVTLRYGYIQISEEQLQPFALSRWASIHLADTIKLPAPTTDEIIEHIRSLGLFRNAQGAFDPKRYSDFRDQLKTNPRTSEADVDRVIVDDIRVEKVQKLLAGPGYTLPADVIEQLSQLETRWTLDVASVDYASFSPAVKVGEDTLKKYFEDNALRYQIPAKVQIRYIDFPTSARLAETSVTDDEAREYYLANTHRFPKPADKTKTPDLLPKTTPATSAEDKNADFEAVKTQVIQTLREQKAQRLTAKAAADISLALFNQKVALKDLPAFVKDNNLTLKDVAPFPPQNVPGIFGASPTIADEVAKLTADLPYSDAITTPTGAAILVWEADIAARQPDYTEVAPRVTADYQADQKRKLFAEAGRTLHAAIETALKQQKPGVTFADAVATAAKAQHLTAKVDTYKDFTRMSPPKDIPGAALQPLNSLSKGQVGEMILSADQKGILVYVVEKKLPEVTSANPRYSELTNEIAEFNASRSGGEQIQALMEAELAQNTTPVAP
ncbi:peptidyl-prolyl cis-trans isomerase [Opitutaceae bacterium TAV4]|nr:peptidyl-prolyl cis-trans isomerase [Opitutaceae bacterium TAV4]